MARNMKMELHTFSPILYQSKKCGHRIHVLFMMYDVYWYCQMKKKRMIMKILKKEWFIWKFEKRGIVEKRGEEETKSMPQVPVMESCDFYYESRFSVLTNCLMCRRSKFLKMKLKMHDGNEIRTIRSSENFCFKHILFTTKWIGLSNRLCLYKLWLYTP